MWLWSWREHGIVSLDVGLIKALPIKALAIKCLGDQGIGNQGIGDQGMWRFE